HGIHDVVEGAKYGSVGRDSRIGHHPENESRQSQIESRHQSSKECQERTRGPNAEKLQTAHDRRGEEPQRNRSAKFKERAHQNIERSVPEIAGDDLSRLPGPWKMRFAGPKRDDKPEPGVEENGKDDRQQAERWTLVLGSGDEVSWLSPGSCTRHHDFSTSEIG